MLNNFVDWRNEQQGFCAGRTSDGEIFIIRCSEETLEFNNLALLCFCRHTKEYDSIEVVDVIKLQKNYACETLIKLIAID